LTLTLLDLTLTFNDKDSDHPHLQITTTGKRSNPSFKGSISYDLGLYLSGWLGAPDLT